MVVKTRAVDERRRILGKKNRGYLIKEAHPPFSVSAPKPSKYSYDMCIRKVPRQCQLLLLSYDCCCL